MNFSVLMATYNRENPKFLDQCLRSVSEQTLKADQFVLVTDGALTPELYQVIDHWKDNLPIELVLYDGCGRLGGALQKGLLHCRYDYVIRMDSDDICVANRFEKQIEILKSDVDITSMSILEFEDTTTVTSSKRKVPEQIKSKDIFLRNPINHMSAAFRKSVILEAGGYKSLQGFEDWYLWLRAYAAGSRFYNSQEVGVYARIGNGFWERRSGVDYFKNELNALFIFYRDGVMPLKFLLLNVSIRPLIRLLPRSFGYRVFKRLSR